MTFYNFKMPDIKGNEVDFEQFRGKVVLVVNTASECGFTPQFEGLETLYQQYKEQGLVVLGFPCNQFGGQDPGSDDKIEQFCSINYGVTFPMFSKIEVNGDNEASLYTWLKDQKGGMFGDKIKWNFTKFLIDRNGEVVDRFAPQTKPESIEKPIEQLL
ncbi:glutathione peroxidase [Savagea sp. SN6]|uniref:Glutathione peroxidase n=1 Tax=Savagea serpentis TaxID=2785297 RepID=A0A8J7G375_9BACL|nr:glutathione peroxidase [Savagea serpentis]MBF4500307.1 glutathione peroxidase [Savagea serpentis]